MAKIQSKQTGDVFEAPAQDFVNEADFTIVDDSTPVTADAPNVPSVGGTSAPAATDSTSGTTDGTADTSSATNTAPASADLGNAAAATDPSDNATAASADSSASGDLGNVQAVPAATSIESSPTLANNPITADTVVPTTDTPVTKVPTASTASSSADSSLPSDTASVGALDASSGDLPVTASQVILGEPLGAVSATDNSQSSAPDTSENSLDPSSTASSESSTVSDSAASDAVSPLVTEQPPVTDSVTGSPTGGPSAGKGNTLDAKSKHIVADQLENDTLFAISQIVTPSDSLRHAADAFFDQVRSQIDVEAAA